MLANRLFISSVGIFGLAASMQSVARADTMEQPSAPNGTTSRTEPTRDSAEREEDRERAEKKKEHFRIGVLGGLGFPRPLAIEGMIKIEKVIGLGIDYSVLPTFSVYGVETRFHALAADARIFPFGGPFFVGVRAGRQHLDGGGTVIVQGYGATGSMTMDTTFVNPRIGFLWTTAPGFSIGIDAGLQIPLSTTGWSSFPPGTLAAQEAMRVAHVFGDSVVPTVDFLRLGLLL